MSMALCLVMLASVLPMSGFTAEATASTATGTAEPTGTAAPEATPAPTATATPDDDTPAPTATPEVTATPAPTDAPEATAAPEDTAAPEETDDSEADAAAAAVQELIDALPAAEELTGLVAAYLNGEELSEADSAALAEAYDKLDAAAEAYYALTDAQRERVNPARLEQLAALFYSEVEPLAEGKQVATFKVDSVEYSDSTLQILLGTYANYASGGALIYFKLLENIDETGLKLQCSVYNFDLAGFTVTNPIDLNGYYLTISDSSTPTTGTVTITNSGNANELAVYGGNVTVKNPASGTTTINQLTVPVDQGIPDETITERTVNIESGSITNLDVTGGTVNISGGTVESLTATGGTIEANGGTLTKLEVTTGEVTLTGTSKVNELDVKGGTVNVATEVTTLNATYNSSTIKVESGGTITTLTVDFPSGSVANVTLKGKLPTAEDTYNVNTINATGGTLTLDFAEPTYTSAEDYIARNAIMNVKSLNVNGTSSGSTTKVANVNVKYGKIGTATVNGGNLTLKKGAIGTLKSESGSVTINAEPRSLGVANEHEIPVNVLNFSGGTLSIADEAHSKALGINKPIIYQLIVSKGDPELKNGVFGWIQTTESQKHLLDLLADERAITGKLKNPGQDDNTEEIIDAGNCYTISNNSESKYSLFYVTSHTCNFSEDKDSTTDGVQCVCGRTCQHASIGADGECEACQTQFAIVGTHPEGERKFYETANELFSGTLETGYTYTLYTDLNSGTDTVTPSLTADISVTFALNSHSFTGTLNLSNDYNKLDLAITGAGDLSGAKLVVKNGTLDLSGWTGGANGDRTLGGISAPENSTATVSGAIKLPTGCVLKEVGENGTETRVLGTAQLAGLAGKKLKIVACTHDSIDVDGKCVGCNQYFVAKLTKTDGSSEYIPYVYSETANKKAKLTALFGSDYVESNNSSNGDIEVTADSAFGKAKTNSGSTLTLLTYVSYNDAIEKHPCVSSGTFTLDLNGVTLDVQLRVKGSADVTIKDSSVNGKILTLYIGGLSTELNGTVTIQSGSFEKVNPNFGTVNITGGKITDLTVSNGGVANVSNATDGTIPEINALTYYSSGSTGTAKLEGGKYKTIKVSEGSKTCIDFLAENCAYFIGEKTIPIDASLSEYNKKIEISSESTEYCFVRSHSHMFTDITPDYPKCACGYECKHPTEKVDAATGECSVCGKQLVVKETDSSSIVAYYPAFPTTVTSGNKYTLLADLKADTVKVTNDTYADITIDLNGHSIVPTADGVTATLDITKGNVAAIIGKGDLSEVKIQLGCTVVEESIKCASVNLAAWDGVPAADGNPANMTIAELSFTNLKKTDSDTSIDSIKYVTLKEGMTIGKVSVEYADDADENTEKMIVRAGNLLTRGCAFQNSDDTYVTYVDNMHSKENLTVVECPHTERTRDTNGANHTCMHCGQALVAELTKPSETTLFYTNINDAFAAAAKAENNGCTVKLLADSTVTTDLTAAGKFTLDLYGHTLALNDGKNLNVTGDLTIISSRKESGENGKINGNVNVADSKAKLTVSNEVKGQSSGLETCIPTIESLTVSNGTVALTGGKCGSLTVSGGTLSVANETAKGTVNGVDQQTTCIPEINILTVNGGDVKLTGGKYGSVNATDSGKTVGNLLANPTDGFKVVKTSTTTTPATSTVTWADKDSTENKLNSPIPAATNETTTITVEQLPIQSITTNPLDGKQTITYKDNTDLQITEINGIDVANVTASFKWRHWDDDNNGTDLDNSTVTSPYIFKQSLDALTGGKTHKLYCDVTVDSYTKTVEFEVKVEKKDLTIGEKAKPSGANNLKYEPMLENNVYTGKGMPLQLMTQANYGETGCHYEYSLDGTTWQKEAGFKQSEEGKYTVYWRICADGNHTINGGAYYESTTPIENVTISPLKITEVRVEKLNAEKTYDGNTSLPTQGDDFKVVLVNTTVDTAGDTTTKEFPLGGDAKSIVKLEYDDNNVGKPKIVAKLNPDCELSKNFTFGENISLTVKGAQGSADVTGRINPAPLKLTAKDKTVLVGRTATIPNPLELGTDYELTGIVKGEETTVKAQVQAALTLKYCNMDGSSLSGTPDTSTVGTTYKIRPVLPHPQTGNENGSGNGSYIPSVFSVAGQQQTPTAWDTVTLGNYAVALYDGTLTVVDCVVTATAGANGSISTKYGTLAADGTIHVTPGDNITFNITPNPGYVVASVTVDGVNLGALSTYTFQTVEKDHTIHATFMLPYANPQTGVEVG